MGVIVGRAIRGNLKTSKAIKGINLKTLRADRGEWNFVCDS
jgi:hypothetical protein